MAEESAPTASPIGRKLALAFGAVSVLATVTCVVQVLLIGRVAGSVAQMQHDEHTIRQGLEVARSIREQYIHIAHTLIVGDRSHLGHYTEWTERAQRGGAHLAELATPPVRARIERVLRGSRALDRLFRERMLPAVERDDRATVRRLHEEAQRLSKEAAEQADEIAQSFEQGMSRAHVDTTQTTRWGLALALGGIALIAGVGFWSTLHLRSVVIRPLQSLTDAALRVARGSFDVSLRDVGEGEFRELARAFDRMAKELRQREVQLVESARLAAIGQLAAGVAHEINNPIGIIRGYLRTMIPEASDRALREELSILDEEAAACQRIAEDLLTYARSPELSREEVQIAELLDETAHRFRATLDGDDVAIEVQAAPGLLSVDPVRLKQVIANLLKNAVQASSREVRVEGEPLGERGYRIRIADRGTGMTPEQHASAFEPFFTGRRGGTGLGLAVCQGIVRAHGGTITASAREGGGSVFEITLPSLRAA